MFNWWGEDRKGNCKQKIFSELDTENIIHVTKAMLSVSGTIKKIRPYIISCFYNNAVGEMWNSRDRPKNIIQNAFNSFDQHDYDFEEIEKALLK